MSEKRPTREEAIEALMQQRAIPQNGLPGNDVITMDRTAALFGGFAPSPVRVPHAEVSPGGESGQYCVVGGRDPKWLTPDQAAAITARSESWEAIKGDLNRAARSLRARLTEGESKDRALDLIDSVRVLMSSTEMGSGPGGGS